MLTEFEIKPDTIEWLFTQKIFENIPSDEKESILDQTYIKMDSSDDDLEAG